MKALRADGRKFDVAIVDPPALIKRRKDHDAGLEHYAALNRAALHLLDDGGILVSCSCSHHLEGEELQRILLRESRSEEHTSELQSLMRISYAVFCLNKKTKQQQKE